MIFGHCEMAQTYEPQGCRIYNRRALEAGICQVITVKVISERPNSRVCAVRAGSNPECEGKPSLVKTERR
jgi:hypothetical protein